MPRGKDKFVRDKHHLGIKSRDSKGNMAKDYYRAYYEKNKDKILSKAKEWKKEAKKSGWKPRGQQNYRKMVISLLLQRDGNKCGICGQEMEILYSQIDHIVPYNLTKDDSATNIQLSHKQCNYNKKRT